MVTCVYSSEPNAYTDKREQAWGVPLAMAHNGIEGGDEEIGGMQTRHRSENISVLAIYAMEYLKTRQGVEPTKASHVARRM